MNLFDMKKLSILTLALFVFAGTAYGQDAQNSVGASVRVVSSLSLTSDQDIDFGTVQQGAGTIILGQDGNVTGGGSANGNFGDAQVGKLSATGAAGEGLSVSHSISDFSDSGLSLSSVTLYGSTDESSGFEELDGSGVALSGSDNINTGNYYFRVGATLDVGNASPGVHEDASVTVTLNYTDL